jgi:hypothetical protein
MVKVRSAGPVAAWMGACMFSLGGCGPSDPPAKTEERTVASLRLIGQQVLPRRMSYQGTVVGGLSGIDYDAALQRYVLISDDRTTTDSANAPRFYFANLTFDETSFSAVDFTGVVTLKQPDGSVYPKVPDLKVADPESIRIDPASGHLVWTSEGDRSLTAQPQRVIDPFIREVRLDGSHVREWTLPSMFRMATSESGPRANLAFEGLAFTPDGSKAAVIMEGPIYADGPAPTPTSSSVSRLTVFDRATGVAVAQYAYPIEQVQAAPAPVGSFTVNGPTEILALSATRFLVLERSFSVGVEGNQVRLYEVDVRDATNVLAQAALTAGNYKVVSKRLVLDFVSLRERLGGIANLEGMTFGPKLANGRNTLVVVADDNFPVADSTTDRNQILVFEVLP